MDFLGYDMTPIYLLLGGFFLLILLFMFLGLLLNKRTYGKFLPKQWEKFEINVCNRFRKLLVRKYGADSVVVLHDALFVDSNGSSTQIDGLAVTPQGILVIEMKNIQGWIFGSRNQQNWTSSYKTERMRKPVKSTFYNPIKQNQGHIAFLERVLPELRGRMDNIVIFSNEATFKRLEGCPEVQQHRNIKRIVKSLNGSRIPAGDVAGIAERIIAMDRSGDREAVRRHIEYAKGKNNG